MDFEEGQNLVASIPGMRRLMGKLDFVARKAAPEDPFMEAPWPGGAACVVLGTFESASAHMKKGSKKVDLHEPRMTQS